MRRIQQLRKLMLKELLTLIQTDTAFQNTVPEIARPHFADKPETAHHFLKPEPRVENLEPPLSLKIADDRKQFEALELKLGLKIAEDRKRFEALEQQFY